MPRASAQARGVERATELKRPARRRWTIATALGNLVAVTALCLSTAILHLGRTRGLAGAETITNILFLASQMSFAAVGAIIVVRRPEHVIGWIFAAVGSVASVSTFADEYVLHALQRAGSLPAVDEAAWISPTVGFLIPFGFILLLLLFPGGRPVSPHWDWCLWLLGGCFLLAAIVGALTWPQRGTEMVTASQISSSGPAELLSEVLGVCALILAVVAIASLIVRFRRTGDIERLQLKWFVSGAAIAVVGLIAGVGIGVGIGSDLLLDLGNILVGAGALAVPIAAGIAILRYRLYEIDRIINRTLVFGALSLLLGLIYVVGVFGLGGALRSLTGQTDNGLAVAASTLAVAAAFRPARSSIQSFIDRRFYRSRYDAGQTLEAFSSRLRDEVDLDELSRDLLGTVRDTVHPVHASLWLRTASRTELR